MILDRRAFLAASAAAAAVPPGAAAAGPASLTPEQFGARGDGLTNDTAAFGRLSAEINRRGGGTVALRAGRTYVVGAQSRGTGVGWEAAPILELHHLSEPLFIRGNGARLRAAPGLRFGTFDVESGEPVEHPMPYVKRSDLAMAYRGMIWVHDCGAPIDIRNVELDGNVAQLMIGGQYGDKGRQVPATGLFLYANLASEFVDNIYSHHHGLDGAMFVGNPARTGRTSVSRLISRYNGRQGLSITGGHGYDFSDCEFSHSGRSRLKSAPAAGLDIEAEQPPLRDLSFARCSFIDNAGCGLVADSGDSADARFADCRFVGTTSWSAWPRKPGFRFTGCTFVGAVVHAFPDADPARAAQFVGCTFTDDPKLSPTGQVYTASGPIVNLAASDNVLFDRCRFALVGGGTLPWSWKAIYRDCTMSQRSAKTAMTKGRYLGATAIHGPVSLYGSMIEGSVMLNGKAVARGPVGTDFKPW